MLISAWMECHGMIGKIPLSLSPLVKGHITQWNRVMSLLVYIKCYDVINTWIDFLVLIFYHGYKII